MRRNWITKERLHFEDKKRGKSWRMTKVVQDGGKIQ
jgi:hypothetical protein